MTRNRAPSITDEIESEQVNAMRARIKRALFNTALAVGSLAVDRKAERKFQEKKLAAKEVIDREKILERIRQKNSWFRQNEATRERLDAINRVHPGNPQNNAAWLATRTAKLSECAPSGFPQNDDIRGSVRGGSDFHGLDRNNGTRPSVTFGKRKKGV